MTKEALETAITALEAWTRTIDTWVLVFSAAVVLGVAGELWAGIAHWRADVQLRPMRAELEQIREVELKKFETAATEANERAEKARVEALRLEAFLATRQPKPEQYKIIMSAIAGKDNLPNLTILTVNDPEADRFALWIYGALLNMKDKITMGSFPLDSELSRFTVGAMLYSFNEAKDPLAEAFKQSKLAGVTDLSFFNGKTLFGFPLDRDTLVIGRREPLPPFGMRERAP